MKRRSLLLLALALALLFSSLGGVLASAYLGGAAEVLAEDITLIKTGLLGQKLVFRDTDVKEALGITDFKSIEISTLPVSTEGTLYMNGRRVGVGQVIKRSQIGALVFVPASAQVAEAHFSITVKDYGGGAAIPCILKFIDKINYAPSIKNEGDVAVWTQSGITVHGRLSATDPEGDACEFIVLSYPNHGTLTVTDKATGEYRYTPQASFTGKDRFSYVVRDVYGNFSEIEEVSLTVDRAASDIRFTDLQDRAEHNAAVVLTAAGVFSGKRLGDDMYFEPENAVSRAEFVAMALKTYGIRADTTLSATFFDDNDAIPTSLIGYVATAQRLGIIHGSFDGTALNFRPNDTVTLCEAAIILSSLIGTEDVTEVGALEDSTVPVWARADVAAMYKLGLYDEAQQSGDHNAPLTRATAAEVLFRMSRLNR